MDVDDSKEFYLSAGVDVHSGTDPDRLPGDIASYKGWYINLGLLPFI